MYAVRTFFVSVQSTREEKHLNLSLMLQPKFMRKKKALNTHAVFITTFTQRKCHSLLHKLQSTHAFRIFLLEPKIDHS